ncbi:MAG TPA: hypothetical protein VIM89_05145 [Mucilaginibacter sp.]
MEDKVKKMQSPGSVIYGMGFLGALVYFIVHAISFWAGALGIIKAIFWPAFVIYKVLELLKL